MKVGSRYTRRCQNAVAPMTLVSATISHRHSQEQELPYLTEA